MMVSSALPDLTMMSVKRLLLRVEVGLGQQFGHAEHAVHRRADLVAHIGQEFRLGAVGEHGACAAPRCSSCSRCFSSVMSVVEPIR